jgi:hypothetical protein
MIISKLVLKKLRHCDKLAPKARNMLKYDNDHIARTSLGGVLTIIIGIYVSLSFLV